MKLHDYLIEELKHRIPNNSELVNTLSNILFLGKESIYRRIRGEVQFTLEEASIISEKIGLSLDGLSQITSLKRPFIFKMSNFANPKKNDYDLINEFVVFLEKIKDCPDTEVGTASKLIPDALHLNYKYITQFYFFKWIYQYENNEIKKFEEVKSTHRILDILKNMSNLLQHIKNTYYIFDKRIIENLVYDIKYFQDIGLINKNDIKLLKEDLSACLADINSLASKGINSLGNKTEIYLSNLNFEAGFSYVKSEDHKLSMIRAFTMYDISSRDILAFNNSLKWMQSLKKASSLISKSGEIERMKFFNKQHDIVNAL